MAQGFDNDQKRASAASDTTTDAPAEQVAADATTYSAAGPIPPVASGSKAAAAPTASQRAYGAGVQALEALLAAGRPDPKQVVELLDAHRDEHDAMFSLLETELGADYVAEVRGAMGLRASIPRREVVDGDPADPNGGYFIASQAEQGAKWRTAGGSFTGTANKDGLDTKYAVDPHDTLHANVKTDKSGTLAWERDGKTEGLLYGSYKDGKDYDAGLRRTWGVGGGQLETSVDHQVAGGVATDAAIGSYKSKDGKTTAKAEAGLTGGKPFEEAQLHTAPTAHSTLDANVKHDAKGTTGELAGTDQIGQTKLDGNVTRAADKTTAHLGASEQLSKAWNLSEKVDETVPDKGKATTTGELAATYKQGDTTVNGNVTRAADKTSAHLDGTEKLSPAWTLNEKLDETVPDKGKAETTGSLGATYKQGTNTFDGNITRDVGKTSLHLDGSEQPAPNWKLTENVDETLPDHGKAQTTVGVGEKYTSGNLVQGLDLEAGKGDRDYLKATGSLDAGLGHGLYAGTWGSYDKEAGHQGTAQLGASLTFTPDEKNALTLAGVIDQNGAIETRLQYDVFKSKIESVSDLADHKKDALVSLFLSYRSDSGHRALDDRFGSPQLDTGPGQEVTAGIRIKF